VPQATASDPTVPWIARFARAALLRVGLLLFGLLVAVLLGEVAVRLLSSEGPTNTFRDAEIGRRFTRSWEGDCYVEEAGRPVHLHFNQEGMRDRDWPTAKPASELRVAVLGDSMVAALATDEAQRFTHLGAVGSLHTLVPGLHMDFAAGEDPGEKEIVVQNWGVAGSSPALAVRLFETRVRHYAPDVVVLTWFLGNDLSDDWQPLGRRRAVAADLDPDRELRWLPFGESSSAASEWLARHSRLYVWQKRLLARARADEAPALRPGLRAFDATSDPVLLDAWNLAEKVIERFAAQVRAAGGAPVLLVLPCAEQVYDDLWEWAQLPARAAGWTLDRDLPSRRLAAIAARASMPCVDVGARLLKESPRLHLKRTADWIFLNGTGHLNDAGHELARQGLKRAIVEPYLDQPIVEGERGGR
jgi:hypothetical protein